MIINHMKAFSYLQAMGIQAWEPRVASAPMMPKNNKNALLNEQNTEWNPLSENVKSCTACALCKTRKQTVFGTGSHQASLMLIGEAPGFYEDQQGEPFVGRAGQLLTAMLEAMGMTRDEVYIANVLKCRPPNNRDPLPAEVELCTPFLKKQIALIQPKLLLTLGRIASYCLLNIQDSLSAMRGKLHSYNNTPLIVTYHPAYLLRNPRDKNKAFSDLQFVQRILKNKN